MSFDHFAKVSDTPLWRAEMALPAIPAAHVEPREDVVVVGSGYSGLNTALHLARGGRKVVIIDAGDVGHGCSTRNGGQVSSQIHRELDELAKEYGEDGAMRILGTGLESHQYFRQFVREEAIACDYAVCGHFIGAHRKDRLRGLKAFGELQQKIGTQAEMVPQERVGEFIDSSHYHGGVHLPDWASVHPGKLVAELVRLVLAEGVRIVPACRATEIEDQGDHITLNANGKAVRAEHVVMGTDGYTDGASKWMERRIVSLASVVMATRPMPKSEVSALYPRASMVYDSRMNVSYHRPTPSGDRVMMGTVVPVDPDNLAACYPRAHSNLLRIFPQLEDISIDHVWSGWVGATFSHLPHVGLHGRIGYAIGYNGTGVAMSAYLGRALARKMLGQPGGETGLDQVPFNSKPFFHGQTWYRRPVLAWHDLVDRLPSRGTTIG
ncbi:NAD(P)/FAD-dependent oxidoreductase [Notoacmeibacter ruber]|uniref:FAD-binding oxidoreductase n=1 Tax=Notoacmeibacter ruber TaxID=2670375 RepID=A0A3L7JBU4_9HYPH|nr:FAD-binding oxidoreductase [Notoacmeibacter ruber]RLQ87001.1 FAD-binding oxidoreductase [Notoacmeibacter ruber]